MAYTVVYGVYNVYLHPLRNFPGPAWYAMSRIPFLYHGLSGDRHRMALRLHQKYGPVVRSAPNELLFNSTEAWKDIMGHKVDGEEFPKNPILYQSGRTPDRSDIIWSSREEHARLRRQLAHGFSEKSMREQEPRIQQYIDLLIRRIHEKGNSGQTALQMDAWYNFTTFDIIGELAFGESFGCLQNSEYHEWVKCIFLSTKMVTYLQIEHCYPFMERFVTRFLLPLQLFRSLALHKSHNKDKLRERIANGPRNDLIEGLLKKQEELKMSMDDLEHNSGVLVVAGSETTATLLSVVTHLLTANPQALARLTDEVRGAFDREDDITFTSASRLPYMLACLNEALRMHTPFPNALPRTSPKGGAVVAGHVVPEDVSCSRVLTAPDMRMKLSSRGTDYRWYSALGRLPYGGQLQASL